MAASPDSQDRNVHQQTGTDGVNDPDLDEAELDEYIISKPALPRKFKKSKEASKKNDNSWLPSTPKKSNPSSKDKDSTPSTPQSVQSTRSTQGSVDSPIKQSQTAKKRIGWLGVDARARRNGFDSPGMSNVWKN